MLLLEPTRDGEVRPEDMPVGAPVASVEVEDDPAASAAAARADALSRVGDRILYAWL